MRLPSMKPYTHHRSGLHPTLRHQLIFVLFSATVIAAYASLLRAGIVGEWPDAVFSRGTPYFLIVSPIWLCVLLLAFDRRGPVRQWYLACVMGAWAALFAVS